MRIKELREEFGLTQTELAKRISSTNKNIHAYEKGYAEPSIETLIKLSEVFDCSIGYLVGVENDSVFPRTLANTITESDKELLENFNKLAPFEQEAIRTQIKALVNSKIKTLK